MCSLLLLKALAVALVYPADLLPLTQAQEPSPTAQAVGERVCSAIVLLVQNPSTVVQQQQRAHDERAACAWCKNGLLVTTVLAQ